MVVAGQPPTKRGACRPGKDRQHDVQVNIERDGRAEGIEVERPDRLAEGLLDRHAGGVALDHRLCRRPSAIRHDDGRGLEEQQLPSPRVAMRKI